MPILPRAAHVAAASLNQTVGDWAGNKRRILDAIDHAQQRGVRLLALPELCVSGYSLGDRLLMRGTIERSWQSLEEIRPFTKNIICAIGLPIRHRDVLYDAVAVVANEQLIGLVAKENLATSDVQYENRWYCGWPRQRTESFDCPDGTTVPIGPLLFDAVGIGRFAIEICEDGWKGIRPGSVYALAGAHILLNPSASWFTLGKHQIRRQMVRQISREDHTVYLYTSLLGCDATRLVFDGSVFIAEMGSITQEGRRFRFNDDSEFIDAVVDLEALQHSRVEEGSWRDQVAALTRGDFGPLPHIVTVPGEYATMKTPPAPPPYWTDGTQEGPPDPSLVWLAESGLLSRTPKVTDLPHLELELALTLGLREYLRKCGIPGITLALSGGRDSGMTALLVHRMHRYDRPDLDESALREYVATKFITAFLATENSSSDTSNAARSIAAAVGSKHMECSIQEALDNHLRLAEQLTGNALSWDDPSDDVTLQNVQARLRGSLIWMVANMNGHLLLATSNKSEAAVGYTTMDGDTSGGIAPIADVPKSLVNDWLHWAAEFHDYPAVKEIFAVPATAELRPPERAQTDEEDLMPFFILDQLMFQFVQGGKGPVEIFYALWPTLAEHYGQEARAFAAHIRKFVLLLCRAQWKRERFAISFRVAAFDLDPKTGFRFPPVQAPFTEELADLDRIVADL